MLAAILHLKSSPEDSTGGAIDRSRNDSTEHAEKSAMLGVRPLCRFFAPSAQSCAASALPPSWGRRLLYPTAVSRCRRTRVEKSRNGGDKLRWRKWLFEKDAVGHTSRC